MNDIFWTCFKSLPRKKREKEKGKSERDLKSLSLFSFSFSRFFLERDLKQVHMFLGYCQIIKKAL